MGKELWMIYDKAGLARNSTFVELFAERGRPYDIAVEAVLDTEYLSLLEKGSRPQAGQSAHRSMRNWKSVRSLCGIPPLSAGSAITRERPESI